MIVCYLLTKKGISTFLNEFGTFGKEPFRDIMTHYISITLVDLLELYPYLSTEWFFLKIKSTKSIFFFIIITTFYDMFGAC